MTPHRFDQISPRFWLALSFGFLAVGLGSVALGVFLASSFWHRPSWRTHTSAEGRYAAEFPGRVREESRPFTTPYGTVTLKFQGTTCHGKTEGYSIGFAELPAERLRSSPVNDILDDACTGAVKSLTNATETGRSEVRVSGWPGKQVSARLDNNGNVIVRVCVAGGKLYTLTALTVEAGQQPRWHERFFASFKHDEAFEEVALGEVPGLPPLANWPGCAIALPFDETLGEVRCAKTQTMVGNCRAGATRVPGARGNAVSFKPKPGTWGGGRGANNPHIVLDHLAGSLPFGPQSNWTISVWVKARKEDGVILSHRSQTNRGRLLNMAVGWGGRPTYQLRTGSESESLQELRGSRSIVDGRWHHLALVCRIDGSVALFLDGQLEGTTEPRPFPGFPNADWIAVGTDLQWANHGGGTGGIDFDGEVDELGYFTRALSEAELRTLAGRK